MQIEKNQRQKYEMKKRKEIAIGIEKRALDDNRKIERIRIRREK